MEILKKIVLNDSLGDWCLCSLKIGDSSVSLAFNHPVYIWVLDWPQYIYKKKFFWGILSPIERKKAARFASIHDQNKFIIVRGILRILIGQLLHCDPYKLDFKNNSFGKPSLTNDALQFNISHSKNQVAYAFCKHLSVGVDIEYKHAKISVDKLAVRYFSDAENKILATLATDSKKKSFFDGWVQKEAIVKALGYGMQIPLSQIDVHLEKGNFQLTRFPIKWSAHKNNLLLHPIKVPEGFAGALAIQTNQSGVVLKQFTKIDY